jgi:hypothetical protein
MEGFSMSDSKNVWNRRVINEVSEITVKSANKTVEILMNKMVNSIPLGSSVDEEGNIKENYIPGKLRKSHATVHATMVSPIAKVVSKGSIAPYNARVHEMTSPDVKWSTPGTGAKWMETTFRNNSQKTFNRVLKGEMKKNGF